MTRNASEIFDDLKALANELEDLAATGTHHHEHRLVEQGLSRHETSRRPSPGNATGRDRRDLLDGNPTRSRINRDETRASRLSAPCPPVHSKSPIAALLFLHPRGQQEPNDLPHTSHKLRYLSSPSTADTWPVHGL